MWKALLAGITALAVAGSTAAFAEQRWPGPEAVSGLRPTPEDVNAFTDARIAALKAVLRLAPAQEALWPAVEQALRDVVRTRLDRIRARRDGPPPSSPIELVLRRAEAMARTAAALKPLADAAEPLYRSLDEAQKRRLEIIARKMRRMEFAHGFRDHPPAAPQ